ncbi:hypothetical protein ARMGADRAFT_1091616 [Armillaria gallica]|uniref:Uncharacterized protein n=1 Tax=Armillaria gallica TaxID=47427 RepID=A0A2H3CRM4_ARMGA|nr:hypothetical protein ARMGADRAFT_1091616 [Armillaria gallica]
MPQYNSSTIQQFQIEQLKMQLNKTLQQLCEATTTNRSLKYAYTQLLQIVESRVSNSTTSEQGVTSQPANNTSDPYLEPSQLDHKDPHYKHIKYWYISDWKAHLAK